MWVESRGAQAHPETAAWAAWRWAGRRHGAAMQRSQSCEGREGGEANPAMRWELEELRASSKLDMQRMLVVHHKDVEELISAQTRRATAFVEPLMEVVAASDDRVSRLDGVK